MSKISNSRDANPDGRARTPVRHVLNASAELSQWLTNGTWNDGRPLKYPEHKAHWPLPLDRIGRIGRITLRHSRVDPGDEQSASG